MIYEILIPTVFFVILWHFAYEWVYLPTAITSKKYDLYEQRDRLRALCIKNKHSMESEDYDYLSDYINSAIKNVEEITIVGIVMFGVIQKPRIPKDRLKANLNRIKTIENSDIQEIRTIFDDVTTISINASILNSGSWLMYILPFLPFVFISLLQKRNDYSRYYTKGYERTNELYNNSFVGDVNNGLAI
jgi:hypothetical protein